MIAHYGDEKPMTVQAHVVAREGCLCPTCSPRRETEIFPEPAIRSIADTSRYDAPTEAREVDAEAALAAMWSLPLKDRTTIALWLLNAR